MFDMNISSDLFGEIVSHRVGKDPQLCISRFEVAVPHLSPPDGEEGESMNRESTPEGELHSKTQTHTRRRKRHRDDPYSFFVTISHMLTSEVEDVGLQLWRGSLLLADFLLYTHMSHTGPLSAHCTHSQGRWQDMQLLGSTVVELGCGVGFLGVILSLLDCKRVYLADMSAALTQLTEKNLATNAHLRACSPLSQQQGQRPGQGQQPSSPPHVRTRVLDWRHALRHTDEDEEEEEEEETLRGQGGERRERVTWLAADVIYDDQVTAHLFQTLSLRMQPGDHLLLTLEKRFNFEISSLSVVAHGYKLFLSYINMDSHLPSPSQSPVTTNDASTTPQRVSTPTVFSVCRGVSRVTNTDDHNDNDNSNNADGDEQQRRQVIFRGTSVPLDFPQAVLGYARSPHLELWDITIDLYTG